ncbi:MAG TPA: glycosyltransferase family 2 protein [Pyrinomonadaceae bacterium]|jgi:glycosyltransferase involved in cell wall biosynthesis|nr:glycosyltransferase family 2 protein [Pyrinomonadaceae bacterium]
MRLDVVIPTYNRCEMLARTLASLLAAEAPAALDVRVIVVDNNSKDATRRTSEEWAAKFGGRLSYVFETKQGRSHALNAGIASASGELVGMIDDDEEVDARWLVRVGEAFEDTSVDFVGGACLPRWGVPRPSWLPSEYPGVIGCLDGDAGRPQEFGAEYEGLLWGGNAVIRREVLARVGPYATELGRGKANLMTGEDRDMFERLMQSGARGLYLPDMVIYHYVPPERLTKRYHRRWCFWNGVSQGLSDRRKPSPVAYLAGVPRWLYGKAARAASGSAREALRRGDPARVFAGELTVWELCGFFYGKHFYKPAGE